MDYRKRFAVEAGSKVRLHKIDPAFSGPHESHDKALPEIQKHVARMDKLQYLLYADGGRPLLVVLQALDAGGKDGVIRHLFSGMNPQGTVVAAFSTRHPPCGSTRAPAALADQGRRLSPAEQTARVRVHT